MLALGKPIIMVPRPHVQRLLEQSNDVESNPGPLPHRLVRPPVPNTVRNRVGRGRPVVEERQEPDKNVHFKDLDDMKLLIERQNEQIVLQKEEIQMLKKKVEDNDNITSVIKSEFGELKKKWQSTGDLPNSVQQNHNQNDATVTKIENLVGAYNDIQDRLYEIDKSWKNNLIFYGIPMETSGDYEDPYATEQKIREVVKRKLRITREMHLNRVTRITHGPDFRGQKPIQVHFANYSDKEEVLRKSKLLRGGTIHISEDFSRKVREHRQELNKFIREIRARDPARRLVLRYDKLYMGNDVFFFNDKSGRVERISNGTTKMDMTSSYSNLVDSVITNEAQQSAHDSAWLRRPRSKYSSRSRPITPVLSRQNSISMDDMSQDEVYGTPQPTPLRSRPVTGRSRERSLQASASMSSLRDGQASPSKGRTNGIDEWTNGHANSYEPKTNSSPRKSSTRMRASETLRSHNMTNGTNGATDTLESDTDTPEEKSRSPDPIFKDEHRYEPPTTPKKSPQKSGNPMLQLAIPRSAKGRKSSVTFKEEKLAPAKYKTAESELDLSDDEAEQDEVLSLETFTNLKPATVVPLPEAKDSNNCTDIVPLFPNTSKKSSMTDLVPVEKVESRSLASFASGLLSSNKNSSFKLPLTGPGGTGLSANGAESGRCGNGSPYSFTSPKPPPTSTSVRPLGSQAVQQGGQQGVLKLNVAIAGEFSMGNFSPAPTQ